MTEPPEIRKSAAIVNEGTGTTFTLMNDILSHRWCLITLLPGWLAFFLSFPLPSAWVSLLKEDNMVLSGLECNLYCRSITLFIYPLMNSFVTVFPVLFVVSNRYRRMLVRWICASALLAGLPPVLYWNIKFHVGYFVWAGSCLYMAVAAYLLVSFGAIRATPLDSSNSNVEQQ